MKGVDGLDTYITTFEQLACQGHHHLSDKLPSTILSMDSPQVLPEASWKIATLCQSLMTIERGKP
jgi:hypothetical protein